LISSSSNTHLLLLASQAEDGLGPDHANPARPNNGHTGPGQQGTGLDELHAVRSYRGELTLIGVPAVQVKMLRGICFDPENTRKVK
jgi:hypothetical protein